MTASTNTTGKRIALGLFVLGLAVFFRLWLFGQVPPGLQHDEIFIAEEAVKLATQGDFRLFYSFNYGQEGSYVWLFALTYRAFGANLMMIRFPSLVIGLLTVALLFRFGCQSYSLSVATVASGLAAVSFWAVFYSRIGLRAVLLPMVVLLLLIFLAELLRAPARAQRRRAVLMLGTTLGFAIYTYTSALALYLAFAGLIVAMALGRWPQREHLRGIMAAALIAAVIALPMVFSRLSDPAGLQRPSDVIFPLQAAAVGDFSHLLANAAKVAAAPAFTGDPTWRYNVAGRPLFPLPVGLLAYLGLVVAITRARRSLLTFFLVAITAFGLIPSLITLEAPSFKRLIITMPGLFLFTGMAVSGIGAIVKSPKAGWLLAFAVLAVTGMADYQAYFVEWVTSQRAPVSHHNQRDQFDTVYDIYRNDLPQLVDYLQESDAEVVAVSTPNKELDPLIYQYGGGEAKVDTHVVFFNALFNIVLARQPTLLLVSPLSPISEKHAHWLSAEYGTQQLETIYRQDGRLAFDVYQLGSRPELLEAALARALARRERAFVARDDGLHELSFPVQFGDLLLLHGVELPERTAFGENHGVHNQLYIEPLRASDESIQLFMHLIDQDGNLVAQRDYLGVPPVHWHPGILFMQDNFVPLFEPVAAGIHHLYLGVYNWRSGERFPVVDADGRAIADQLYLGEIRVVDRPA